MLWYKRIRDLRIDNDLTKTELANKLDISERTLARYETGESEPTISVLIKMSHIFDVSIDYICCIKDETFITEVSTKEVVKISENLISIIKRIE